MEFKQLLRRQGILTLALAMTALGACMPACAQVSTPTASFLICRIPGVSTHSFSWATLEAKYSQELEAGKIREVQKSILSDLAKSLAQRDRALLELFESKASDILDAGGPCCAQFAIKDVRDKRAFKRRLTLFDGAIDLTDCGPQNERAEQLDEFRYVAQAIETLGRREVAPAQEAGVRVMQDAADRYDRMLFSGFPMFPWESLVNSWLWKSRPPKDGPPHDLLVLVHPSLGAEARTTLSGSRLAGSLAIEPLGWIHYPRSRKHKTWFGVSTLATFRGDMGLGLGALARLQNFAFGVVWHDDDKDGRPFNGQPYAFIGLDLYQFAGKQLRRYDDFTDRVEAALNEAKKAAETPR